MKNSVVIKLMTFLVLMTSSVGCKNMLEEYNPSGTTAEAVYTTPVGYEALVAAAYSYTRYWYGKEDGLGAAEFGTDIWTAGSESMVATSGLAAENRPLILYQSLNPVNQNLRRLWRTSYSGVNTCNAGIKIAEDGGAFKPNAKRVAELYFLRAFYYYHIVETWGGVHFTTEPTTKPTTTANRTPENVFYDQMIADLQKAIASLDDAEVPGRININAAKGFLARVYLTRGYKSFGSDADFVAARDLANEVILSPKSSLLAKYSDLWDMTKQNNDEVIWSVNYSTDFTNTSDVYDEVKNPYGYGLDVLSAGGNPTTNRGSNNLHAIFVPGYDRPFKEFATNYSLHSGNPTELAKIHAAKMVARDVRNGWPFIRVKPTKYLVDLFDPSKDARWKGSFQTVFKVNYAVPTVSGANNTAQDNRLVGRQSQVDTALVIDKNPTPSSKYFTYNVYDSYAPDGGSVTTALTGIGNQLFPSLIKHLDSTRSPSPNDQVNGNVQSARDVFVIRKAEMYLISAEANFKLSNPGEAANKINVLRTRAALPGQVGAMQVSGGDITLDFILDERAREFAGEYMRWFDLKRTGTLVSRVQLYNPDLNIQSFHTLRPIPQEQMDVVTNKGEFIQNGGY